MTFKKTSIFLIIFIIFILSSCSDNNKLPDEIIKGEGLKISFSLTSDKWISTNKQIKYKFILENTGKHPIELNPGTNLKINSQLKTNDPQSYDRSVFTSESVANFYQDIFKDSNNQIFPNQKKIIEGNLEIVEEIFKNPNIKNFKAQLFINYDYITEFSNNLEFNLKNNEFKILDTLSQAAPIKITKMELDVEKQNEIYNLLLYISDEGQNPQKETIIIEDWNIEMRGIDISSNCKAYKIENSRPIEFKNNEEVKLNKEILNIILRCPIPSDEEMIFEKTTSIISGNLKYNYKLSNEITIKLPDNREGNFN